MKWKRSKSMALILAAVAVVIAFPAGRWVGRWAEDARPGESPLDRAHRICGECRLTVERTDQLIDNVQHSTLSREENFAMFLGTFEDPDDAELCLGCAEAVMDATSHGRPAPTTPRGRP